MSVADACAWRGDADRAFAWLERAHERRVGLSEVKADPLLRKIRGDPRYAALLRTMRLPVD
jgi:serine/threonine-protein kinase